MIVDLNVSNIFTGYTLKFDKKNNVFYGKNGTGKSTLAQLIVDSCEDKYIKLFNGFEGTLGENGELNAVVLGEENVEINKEISLIEKSIEDVKTSIEKIDNELSEDVLDSVAYQHMIAEKNCRKQEEKLVKFYIDTAKKIKEHKIQVAKTSYNKNDVYNEEVGACLLSETELTKLSSLIKSEVKIAPTIDLLPLKIEDIYKEINNLITTELKEYQVIERFSHDGEKTKFAQVGLSIHKEGDFCAFCGNVVTNHLIEELQTFFSKSDVDNLTQKIELTKNEVNNKIQKINEISINKDLFYPQFADEISNLDKELVCKVDEIKTFLSLCIKQLSIKKENIFSISEPIHLSVPEGLDDIILRYNEIASDNNASNGDKEKEDAKSSLRKHMILKEKIAWCFENEKEEKTKLEVEYKSIKGIFNQKKQEKEKLIATIKTKEEDILKLKQMSMNEEVLANNINDKLKPYVDFRLIHEKNDEIGFYKIKCNNTEGIRRVDSLSTGEKNIIAFLYFIEKLNETTEDNADKIIIFDDPMNSNDEIMQYVIIEELQRLMKSKDRNIIVVLTHNAHFYINLRYGFKYKDNNFFGLHRHDGKTSICKIDKVKDDIQTSYDSLWRDLKFAYENAIKANLMLNSMRRILETYCKFNSLDMTIFISKVTGAKKFLDVNSHSVDDIEADLIGMEKDEVLDMFKSIFVENGAISHYDSHWGD